MFPLMQVIQTLELDKLPFLIQIQGLPLIIWTRQGTTVPERRQKGNPLTQGVPLIIWIRQGTTVPERQQKGKPLIGDYAEPVPLQLPY